MMTGLKVFRLVPFCLLLLAGNVFAAGNGSSGSDISNYAAGVRSFVMGKMGNTLDRYKGKWCAVRIHLLRDGSLSEFNIKDGDPDLCNELSGVMRGIKKFPSPPSDAVYQKIKDALLDFKP